MTLSRRLQALEKRAGIERITEAEQERRERDSLIGAYTRSPAGRDMDCRLAALARHYCSAIYDAQHPELQTGEPCPRCGNRASPHICGPKHSLEAIAADFMAAQEEAYQFALSWLAEGAPGALDWNRQALAEMRSRLIVGRR